MNRTPNSLIHPSKRCRFCDKNLSFTGSKVPRVCLYNSVQNKELVGFCGLKSVVLADVVSFLGHELKRGDEFSKVSCLTCARTCVRIYATFIKLTSNSNVLKGENALSTKRLSNSPTGISPFAKRTRLGSSSERSPARRPRCSLGLSSGFGNERKNSDLMAGISELSEKMDAGMNLPGDTNQTVMKVFIGYPVSGKVNEYKLEKRSTRHIVKNVVSGNERALVKAVYRDEKLKELVLIEAINEIKSEIKIRLYAKDPDCLLRLETPTDLKNFSNELLYEQLAAQCPRFTLLLGSMSKPGKLKTKLPNIQEMNDAVKFRNSVCLAASICLRQTNQQLNASHYRNALLLLNGGTKALALERCANLGICVQHKSAIRMQEKAASTTDNRSTCWKQDTMVKELKVKFLEEVLEKQAAEDEVDMQREEVQDYDYFDEGLYLECCSLLQNIREPGSKKENGSSQMSANVGQYNFTQETVQHAVQELKKSIVHYKLVTDNVDFEIQARHQSKSHRNKSLHWTHSFAVKNRVSSGGVLDSSKPQKQVENLQMSEILPSQDDQQSIKSSLIPLVFRVICKYIPAYKAFCKAVIPHIPHVYSSEMKKKSEQCLLGLEFLNPNKSGDMAEILKRFQEQHVPTKHGHVLHKTIVHGDQLTEERGRNVQWTYTLGDTEVDRLEGLENTFSEFHFKMCMYEVNNKIFVKEESAGEKGTSFAEMNRSDCSNAKKGPAVDYNAFKDFHQSETSAHIIAAWMEFAGMDSIEGLPEHRRLPDSTATKNWGTEQMRNWLSSEIGEFLNAYAFTHTTQHLNEFVAAVEGLETLQKDGFACNVCGQTFKHHSTRVNHERTQHGQVPNPSNEVERDEFGYYICRSQCGKRYKTKQGRTRHERNQHQLQETELPEQLDTDQDAQQDYKHNYHCARLMFGLLIMLLDDSVKEGDSDRLLKCMKVSLLLLYTYKRVKYAYAVLLFLAKVHAILSENLAFELLQNRFFNSSGRAGGNIPLDLRMEHLNKLLKIALKQLGSNITETSAQRIAKSLSTLECVLKNVDNDCQLKSRSGFHSSKHLDETIISITQDLNDEKVFSTQPGRSYMYASFKGFKGNILHKLDYREFFNWASAKFKLWQAVYYKE